MTQNSSNPNWTPQPELPLLRQKVDQIDLQLLALLKERSSISHKIGLTKRERNAPVYAPEREQAVMDRLLKANDGEMEPRVLKAIYREILAGSRQAQNPPAIGYLGSDLVYWAVRAQMGQAEKLVRCSGWEELKTAVQSGNYALGLVPVTQLAALLSAEPDLDRWCSEWIITGVFDTVQETPGSVQQAVAALAWRAKQPETRQLCNRILLLIRCKTPEDAVNKLQGAMAETFTATQISLERADMENHSVLAQLSLVPNLFPELIENLNKTVQALHLPLPLVLGVYWYGEDYGG